MLHNDGEKTGVYEISTPLKKTMQGAGISYVSVAALDNGGKIKLSPNQTEAPSRYAAASLSKPVFAYLVLKLIEENRIHQSKGQPGEFKLPSSGDEFNLDTPLHKVFPDIFKKFRPEDHSKVEKLTARMILTHTSGLPITHNNANGPPPFLFSPGTNYCYSGPGIKCLQDVIEHITGSKLETLAKHYVFTPCKMHDSSFDYDKTKPPEAANSLYTTALDYAKFIREWLHDPSPAMQEAFKPGQPELTMRQAVLPADHPIKDDTSIPDDSLRRVSWGLGIGLQLDDRGKTAECAYHSGDAGDDKTQWRAWVAMNVTENNKSAVVYFCPSPNGHILAEQIIPPVVKLDHAFNFFFKTFGFARNANELCTEEGPERKFGLRKGSLQAREERPHKPPSPFSTKLEP